MPLIIGVCAAASLRQARTRVVSRMSPGLKLSLERQGKEIIPLDITLSEKNRILVISGPNAGGKSVTLKTVAIVQYMTQCGILPPVYDNSHTWVSCRISLSTSAMTSR